MTDHPPRGNKDKLLFTPGPLTTSYTVKQAMLRDLGSRDTEFVGIVRDIRRRLLEVAEADPETYCAILMQGSGTFAVESVISSTVPPDGAMLVMVNGAYGRRMVDMARVLGIRCVSLNYPEDTCPDPDDLDRALASDPGITHVAVVHCETTTGIVNPIQALGDVVARHGKSFVVDAMSSFGGIPVDLEATHIDYLVTSANKCLEGIPGFGIVLARREALKATRGFSRSYSLDLLAQSDRLEADGQFRFTPPTHALVAFRQALVELDCEGGVAARSARYRRNHLLTLEGMVGMGFEPYLRPEYRGHIITAFRYPDHPRFSFDRFYGALNHRGHVIYPGQVSHAPCFRIGHIGHVFTHDVMSLLTAVEDVMEAMGMARHRGHRPWVSGRGEGTHPELPM